MAATTATRMPAGLRAALYVVFGCLWVTGAFWLVLHELCARAGPFGPVPHPWEPPILRLHGSIAVAAVFLLGWVTSRHISDRWLRPARRFSGLTIAGVAVILAISGYALYYTTDGLHETAAVAHEVLGSAALVFALTHWRGLRSRLRAGGAAPEQATGR